jgi:putative nucleotidyltransferase with HDIG domain
MELVGDEDHSLGDIVHIVEFDPGLTAQILKVVNSPVFGLRQPMETVQRAVAYLGEKMIVGIAIGSCAPQVFHRPLEGYDSGPADMWEHSLKTAIASRELASLSKEKVSPEVAFTAGLLHDIGKSVLSYFLKGRTEELILRFERGETADYLQSEDAVVGTNHCKVGLEMARHWRLPEPLQGVILHHHYPSRAKEGNRSLVYTVHLGDMVAMASGTGTGIDAMGYRLDGAYKDYLVVDRNGLEKLVMSVIVEFEKARASIFGL